MVEYSIGLTKGQRKFLLGNYDALFFQDKETYNLPKITPERLESLRSFYNTFSDEEKIILSSDKGITGPSSPHLYKIFRPIEVRRSKKEFDKNSRSIPVVRSLYGIIGFTRIRRTFGRHFHNYFIPESNLKPLKGALASEKEFIKEFPDDDLHILDVIYERNLELREKGITYRYPLFYISEIAKRANVKRDSAERSLYNLIGVLGFCWEKEPKYFARRWFVPKARESLIEKLIH